jgi:uncharacterized protein
MPSPEPLLHVSVVYALPDEQQLVALRLPSGSTVGDAVRQSGLLQRFPAIEERALQCAVFNRVVAAETLLSNGDRVEILRRLQIDPKEQRRREATRARAATKSGKGLR